MLYFFQSMRAQLAIFMALSFFGARDFTAAKKYFTDSLAKAPQFFSARYMLGETYLRLGDTLAAENHYSQALMQAKDPGLLLKAGLLAEKNGDLILAEQRLLALVDIAAGNTLALNQLAWFYASHAIKLDSGVVLAQKAIALEPNDSNIQDTLGWLYFGQKNYPAALKTLSYANTLAAGKSQSILYHLAMAHMHSGDREAALKQANTALTLVNGNYKAELTALVEQLKRPATPKG